jgi:hypothetical protein
MEYPPLRIFYDEPTQGSRALQDAIYRHDWLYNPLRKRNEDLTSYGAKKLVAEVQQKLKISEMQ